MATASNFLWERITDKLVAEIRSGAFDYMARFPTTDDISKRFNTSNITSRRVLAELESRGLIEKSRGKGCRLKPTLPACSEIFVTGEYLAGGPLLHKNHIFCELLKGMATEAAISSSKLLQVEYRDLVAFIGNASKSQSFNVAIIQSESQDPETMNALASSNVRTVIVHRHEPFGAFPLVTDDLFGAAALAIRHLAGQGRRKIAMISREGIFFNDRFDAYYRTTKELALDFNLSWVKPVPNVTPEVCSQTVDELLALPERPDAIFAANDALGINTIARLVESGVDVPNEIAVVGIDNMPEGRIAKVPLTTVDLQWHEQGRETIRLLAGRLRGSDCRQLIKLPPLLVKRASA